jgi:GNAT superfamily N-acetyltransferase
MQLRFEAALPGDAAAFAAMQNLAFYDDFVRYGTCPGYGRSEEQLLESIRAGYNYRILADGELVGRISAKPLEAGCWYIGCLCITPSHHRRGIGRAALAFLEREQPQVTRWTLVTPADQQATLPFTPAAAFRSPAPAWTARWRWPFWKNSDNKKHPLAPTQEAAGCFL